jgi:hypothetical protein
MERCPRCGMPGTLLRVPVGSRVYYYVQHYLGGGKRKRCYIGPRAYRNVERLHGMGLAGMVDEERWARYLEAAVERTAEELVRSQEGVERLRHVLLKVRHRIDELLAASREVPGGERSCRP